MKAKSRNKHRVELGNEYRQCGGMGLGNLLMECTTGINTHMHKALGMTIYIHVPQIYKKYKNPRIMYFSKTSTLIHKN